MIRVSQWAEIRHMHMVQQIPKKEIARRLGLDVKTVRRALDRSEARARRISPRRGRRLESAHRAIGASTAVFAALGLVSGYVWRAKLMAQDRWPLRLGPIVGGIALLAYTGTGDENTDIGAHLAGFVCGFLTGMILTLASRYLAHRALQFACGIAAILLIVYSWLVALQIWG